jgi:hypothetical protein
MGFITHAVENAINPGPGNLQRSTDAANLGYQHTRQARDEALAILSKFLGANPNPASGWGAIKGPDLSARPSSVGGSVGQGGPMPNPAQQAIPGGSPGQTPGIVAGPGGGPAQLMQILKQAMQQKPPAPAQPLPPIQLPHPGPVIRMGPQQ